MNLSKRSLVISLLVAASTAMAATSGKPSPLRGHAVNPVRPVARQSLEPGLTWGLARLVHTTLLASGRAEAFVLTTRDLFYMAAKRFEWPRKL